jgi:hypothetical protein
MGAGIMIKSTLYIVVSVLASLFLTYSSKYTAFETEVVFCLFWIGLNVQDLAMRDDKN